MTMKKTELEKRLGLKIQNRMRQAIPGAQPSADAKGGRRAQPVGGLVAGLLKRGAGKTD
jgi:hypothetical protein